MVTVVACAVWVAAFVRFVGRLRTEWERRHR